MVIIIQRTLEYVVQLTKTIDYKDFNYVDGAFILVVPPPPSEPTDFSQIQFPVVKKISAKTIGDDLI